MEWLEVKTSPNLLFWEIFPIFSAVLKRGGNVGARFVAPMLAGIEPLPRVR